MTVTTYILRFVEKCSPTSTVRYYAPIAWDKHGPNVLEVQLCPMLSAGEAGFAVWRATAPYGRKGLQTLISKVKAEAANMGLELESEKPTDFPVEA